MQLQHERKNTWFVFGLTAVTLATSLAPGLAASSSGDPPAAASSAHKHGAMQAVPRLQPKRVVTVTGNEDWESERGFGRDSAMAEMMTLMMVGGSGMEHMKMGAHPASLGTRKSGMTMAGGAPGANQTGAVRADGDFNAGNTAKGEQPAGPKVSLITAPGTLKPGKNTLQFILLDAAGKPLTGAKVTTAVAMSTMDMGTAHPQAREEKEGRYTVEAEFSMVGPWRITLTVTPPYRVPSERKAMPFTRSFDVEVKE